MTIITMNPAWIISICITGTKNKCSVIYNFYYFFTEEGLTKAKMPTAHRCHNAALEKTAYLWGCC